MFWGLAVPLTATALPRPVTATDASHASHVVPKVRVAASVAPKPTHQDVPATTVLSGATLRSANPTLGDTLAQTAGMKAERAGGIGHTTALRVRASSTQQVTWALDDIALQSPDGAPFDPADLPVSALARAELYRGGSPAALGGQAIGGTVRLVLRRPREAGFNLVAGTGSWGTHMVDGAACWRSAGDGLLAFRAVKTAGDYPYLHDGGTLFATADDLQRARRNNDVQRASAVLRHRFRLARWSVEARAIASVREQGLPGLALYESLQSRLLARRLDTALTAGKRDLLTNGDRLVATAYVGHQHTAVDDPLGEQGIPIELRQNVMTQALNVRWQAPANHKLRINARAGAQTATLSGRDKAQAIGRPDVGQHQVDLALGGNWRHSRATALTATVATTYMLRDRWNLAPEAAAWARVDAPNIAVASAALSGRHRINDALTLRVGARAANRPPNLAELYGNNGTIMGNALLREEQAISGEVGVSGKGQVRSPSPTGGATNRGVTMGYAVTAYGRWASALISLARLSPVRAVYQNIGRSTTLGVETTGWLQTPSVSIGELAVRLRVDGQHNLNRARDASSRDIYRDKPLPFAPLTTSHFGLQTQVMMPWAWARRADIRGQWSWRAGHFADRAATIVIPPMSQFTASADLHIGPLLKCGVWATAVIDDGAFDILGFPRPQRMLMARCAVDSWEAP